MSNLTTEDQHMVDYIRRLDEIEIQMQPLKDMKKALKDEFHDEGKLNKEQTSLALQAYRLLKKDVDLDDLLRNYSVLRAALRGE